MRISSSAFIATALVGMAACSNPECLENEEKVGNTCYPVRTTATADAAAATASDSGAGGDGGTGVAKLDGAVGLDAGNTRDASGAAPVSPVPPEPAADAAPSSSAPGQTEPDSGAATLPPKVDAADAATTPAPDAASATPPDSGPPPKCGGGPVNACGGCDTLAHQPDEPCTNGGMGVCDRPGTYRCLGEVTVCSAPPPMPGQEVCDGIDNDCDGQIDDGVLNACGKCGEVPAEVCDAVDNDCDGMKDEGGVCPPPATVSDIATGANHACAVMSTGSVTCWGYNYAGQVGVPASQREPPTTVPGLSGVAQVAAGFLHSCARMNDGSVSCWGEQYGWTAPDVPKPTSTPTKVPLITDAVAITAGGYSTCVLHRGGTVSCWGSIGGIGGPERRVQLSSPTLIANLSRVAMISTSGDHVCAVTSSPGDLRCWGANDSGQLGDGGTTDSKVPIVALQSSAFLDVAVGQHHSCFVANNTGACFGRNDAGQLGLGITGTGVGNTALQPPSGLVGKRLVALKAGGASACALQEGGGVSCWGDINKSSTPLAVEGLTGAVAISVGAPAVTGFACARTAAGSIRCWGSNATGQLGVDPATTMSSTAAIAVPTLP